MIKCDNVRKGQNVSLSCDIIVLMAPLLTPMRFAIYVTIIHLSTYIRRKTHSDDYNKQLGAYLIF